MKRRDAGLKYRIVRGGGHEHANPSHPVSLLRTRCERPYDRCAAKKRDELAPLHVRPRSSGDAIVPV
jgi:hypothetical protein